MGRWRFVKRVQEYVLQSADVDQLSNRASTQRVRIGISKYAVNGNELLVSGFKSIPYISDPTEPYVASINPINGDAYIHVPLGTYPLLSDAQTDLVTLKSTKVLYQLATPITIDEADFNTYGIDVQGSLSSNLDYTEFFVNDYDLFTEPTIDYAGNLSQAVSELKQSVDGLRLAVDGKASKVQEPVISPTLLNGWVNFGGTAKPIGYYKDDFNVVTADGVIKSGTMVGGTVLFVLPVGYRPPNDLYFVVLNSNGATTVECGISIIASSGEVKIFTGASYNTILAIKISFKAVEL